MKRFIASFRRPRCPVCRERTRYLRDHLRFDHFGETL